MAAASFTRPYDVKGKRVLVVGSAGMVGSALVRRLALENCEVIAATRHSVDLMHQGKVQAYFRSTRPHALFMAAAKVGGILANDSFPADFLYENLTIETNVIHAAFDTGVEKMVFLGSSCIYPKFAAQPIDEASLLTGPLEPTNQWYAIAKIAGLKLAEAYRRQHGCDFVSAMPTNLYGPGDNYDLATSHVIPALLRKTHEAKLKGDTELVIWGTGTPRREFLHVDDCADALVHILKHYSDDEHINVGSGSDLPILELVKLIANVVGFGGRIVHDTGKPDGTPRKLMSGAKLAALGWRPRISLRDGLASTYAEFLKSHST